MLNNAQKQFLLLCEAIVTEDSKLPNILGRTMSSMALIKFIHSNLSKSHEYEVKPVGSIDLSWIKKYGGFYVIQGDEGFVVISGSYTGLKLGGVKKGQQTVDSQQYRNIPEIRKFIKTYAGKPEKYFRGETGVATSTIDLKRKRAANKTVNRAVVNTESLFERFRPLFMKAGQAAIADIRGVAMNMLKSGNYSDLEDKVDRLKALEKYVNYLDYNQGKFVVDDPDDRYNAHYAKEYFQKVLKNAVEYTAVHYSGKDIDPLSSSEASSDDINKLFGDIQNGDTKKLSTLLSYFKNGLVR